MKIFLKENHRQTGIHRFLESFTILDDFELILIADIKEAKNYNADKAIFGGFVPSELTNVPEIPIKYYTFCSPIGQADLSSPHPLSAEMVVLSDALFYKNDGVITNIITSSDSLAKVFDLLYFPPVKVGIEKHITFNKERYGYGFLGNNLRKHKNTANQIAAISMVEPKEDVFVRDATLYKNWWGHLYNLNYVSKDLSFDMNYYAEIATHKLCFQCSYSESFDYQVLEYAFMGVPSIVSPCIEWYPYTAVLGVNNADNPVEIADVANRILKDEDLYWQISDAVAGEAILVNNANKEIIVKEASLL